MANTIKLAHNATSGKTPTNLAAGEVAINSANKKIWVGTNGTTGGQVLVFDPSLYSTDLSDNDTTYSAGSGLSLSGTTFSHSDTSSQSSSNNSGRTYIQDVTLDTYGHVTGLATATETVTNTDTNTTYSAGSGLSLSSTTFSHADTSSQSSVNGSGRTYIQDVTLDTYGHVTGLATATETVTNTDTNTTYSAGSGLSLSSTTFSHSDTSSQGSVNNSGRTYIQDVTLDTYGHVTGLASATETVTNTNTTYSAGNGLSLSGTTFSLGAAWANMPAGIRTNYTLGIQAPNSGYAGFYFQGDGNASNANAGYLLVRGASGGDVYTTQGITLVADLGWLSLAQRTTSGKGVRIMSGTSTSTERLKITTAGDIQFVNGNSFTYNGNNVATQAWVTSQGYSTTTGDITGVTAGAGLTGGGTSGSLTIAHNDTSSQSSVNNSGRTYIQDVTLDTYGHVTGLASATETVTNTDTNTTYTAGTGLSLSGTTFSLSTPTVLASAGSYVWSQATTAGSYTTGLQCSFVRSSDGWPDYGSVLHVGARGGTDAGGDFQIYCGHGSGSGGNYLRVRNADNNASPTDSWTSWRTIWDSGNVSGGGGISVSGTTVSHTDTSSQGSVNNSGRTYIQDVTLDTYGHVTGLASATETVTNTDTNTTYSAGSGLSLSGTSFSHSDTSSASSVNNSGRTYIQDVTLDTYGHVTGLASATETVTNTDTNTTYSAGSGLSLSSTTFSHSDTSSQASVNNSGRTYIQDVTLDTYGHVTSLASATETVTNTDTNTTYSAGSGISLSGTTFSHADTSSSTSANNSGRTYVQDITLDTYGHVTALSSATETVTNTNTVREIYLNASSFLNNSSGGAAFDLRTSSPLHFSYSSGGVAILAHYDTAGNKHIPSGGSSNQYLIYASNGTANWSTIAFSHLQNLSALNALP